MNNKSRILIIALALLMLLLLSPLNALGQGRGNSERHLDKKCGKFVNCHDARDGRWDGRGPQRDNRSFRNWHSSDRWSHRRHYDQFGRARWHREHRHNNDRYYSRARAFRRY